MIQKRSPATRQPCRIRMKRRQRFGKEGDYQSNRLISGFYYYLYPEKVGDREKGWLMMAHDPLPVPDYLRYMESEAIMEVKQ